MAARRNILVTGSSGYVGRLLVGDLASRGRDVAGVVALDIAAIDPRERLEGVIYAERDICDPGIAGLLRDHRIDTVVHLASIVRTPKGAPKDLAHRVDVGGTRNVLEACTASGVRKLVVTSSGAAYGYHADNRTWLDENDALRGNDAFEYARNKRLVEAMLADYRRSHPELAQVVFRPGTIVGENVRSPVTDLFEQPFVLGVAGSDAPFVFIWDRDLIACLVEAALSDKTGVFNQAGDGAVSPREIAHILHKPYLPLPAFALKAALWLLKMLNLSPNGPERVDFLRYRPVLSNRRLKEEFGYTPHLSSRAAFELYARARGMIDVRRRPF